MAILAAGVALSACAAAPRPTPTTPAERTTRLIGPGTVTAATYGRLRRVYRQLPTRVPERGALRKGLAEHLVARCDGAVAADHYDDVVDCLAELATLYTPVEYAEGALPEGLSRAAQYLVTKGSPRGDEARVLSGLLIARLLHPDDAAALERYQRLAYWSFDVRAGIRRPVERLQGLVEAWEEHARLSPTPEVMATVERLYAERRDALVQLFRPRSEQAPSASSTFEGADDE